MAVNYLFALGHRKIAFVGGQSGVTITNIRLRAYRQALMNLHTPVDEELIVLTDYYVDSGYEAIRHLIDHHTSFSAFVAVNDNVALGAERALWDYGYSIPRDVAVISCEQFPNAEYHIPRLTSVNQHHEILARTAISTLLNIIWDIPVHPPVKILPELIIRESSGNFIDPANHNAVNSEQT